MNASNLSTCWAPNLLRSKDGAWSLLVNVVVSFMIEKAGDIFSGPEDKEKQRLSITLPSPQLTADSLNVGCLYFKKGSHSLSQCHFHSFIHLFVLELGLVVDLVDVSQGFTEDSKFKPLQHYNSRETTPTFVDMKGGVVLTEPFAIYSFMMEKYDSSNRFSCGNATSSTRALFLDFASFVFFSALPLLTHISFGQFNGPLPKYWSVASKVVDAENSLKGAFELHILPTLFIFLQKSKEIGGLEGVEFLAGYLLDLSQSLQICGNIIDPAAESVLKTFRSRPHYKVLLAS